MCVCVRWLEWMFMYMYNVYVKMDRRTMGCRCCYCPLLLLLLRLTGNSRAEWVCIATVALSVSITIAFRLVLLRVVFVILSMCSVKSCTLTHIFPLRHTKSKIKPTMIVRSAFNNVRKTSKRKHTSYNTYKKNEYYTTRTHMNSLDFLGLCIAYTDTRCALIFRFVFRHKSSS